MAERPVTQELLELAFQLAGRLREEIQTANAALDLPPAQAQALANLHTPAPMRDLASFMGCDASNVTGIVDGLERRGLLRREPDPDDRRVRNLVLTEEGERKRAALHANAAEVAATVFDIPAPDQEILRGLLTRLVACPETP